MLASSLALTAYGQTNSNNPLKKINSKTKNAMDLTKISNEKVQKAIDALQQNDKKAWYSYFTANATFTDDGRTLDFKGFFENAFAKKEKFLEISKIEDNGKHITGKFYAGQWGTFNVFFKFHQDADGKFSRLDIGQAGK